MSPRSRPVRGDLPERDPGLGGPHPDFAGIVVLAGFHQMGCHRHHFAHDGHHGGHFLQPSLHQMMIIGSKGGSLQVNTAQSS